MEGRIFNPKERPPPESRFQAIITYCAQPMLPAHMRLGITQSVVITAGSEGKLRKRMANSQARHCAIHQQYNTEPCVPEIGCMETKIPLP